MSSTLSDACPISNPIASNLTSTILSDTTGVAGTTYYYFVAATNNCPQSSVSTYSTASAAIIYPPVGSPAISTNLVASAAGTSQVNLSWTAAAGAAQYVVTRSSGGGAPSTIGIPVSNSFVDNQNLADGTTYVYRVAAMNSCGQSAFSNPDIATTILFADDPLVPMQTVIKTVHLSELRSAVNAVRIAGGLEPFVFTDSDPAGMTIKAIHVQELRIALDEARSMIGLPQITYMNALTSGSTPVRAIDVTEIRDGVK
jgi:hypothetical protein